MIAALAAVVAWLLKLLALALIIGATVTGFAWFLLPWRAT